MIHPHTEVRYISSEIGYGLVATKLIPKGTITWALDDLDRTLSPAEVERLNPLCRKMADTYCFRNNQGAFVLCWDNGKYVNHSFNSNCLTTAYDFELAIRDILPGEQVTDDYGYLNISEPFKGINEGTRRKIVYPDDLLKYHKVWDKKIERAFREIKNIHQPLLPLLKEEILSKIDRILEGAMPPDSILANYYKSS